jgi:penicillin-binding protein 1A
MIQAPEYYSPFDENNRISPARVARVQERQRQVLQRMQDLGWISASEAATAAAQPLVWGKVTSYGRSLAPYVSDAVVEELAQQFGRNTVISGGLRIQTTIDLVLQQQAEAIAKQAQQEVEQQGLGADQIALVAIDPRTHFIKALVGGKDYRQSQFNRVFQARRQPGSAFKPLVYYQALASGRFRPSSPIQDSPYTVRTGGELYQPRNADGGYYGSISLTQALAASRNIPAVWLGQEVGLEKVIGLARELGIRSPLKPVASLPLGAGEVTPLELTNAYASFASGGWYAPAQLILQVRDSQGRLLVDNRPTPRRVLDPKATADLTKMLQAVVSAGTGAAARLDRPVAGKTGTTSDARDIWFIGYVPELVTTVWLGNDDYRPMSTAASGGGFAAPIWRQFMLKALKPLPKPEAKPEAKPRDAGTGPTPTAPTAPTPGEATAGDRP